MHKVVATHHRLKWNRKFSDPDLGSKVTLVERLVVQFDSDNGQLLKVPLTFCDTACSGVNLVLDL